MNKRIAAAIGTVCIAAALCSGCQAQATQPEEDTYHGEVITGWQEAGGKTFYYLDDGTMATGWLELDGKQYYFRGDGARVTGWLSLEGQRYYLNTDGSIATGVVSIDGKAYVFGADGCLTSGWVVVDGKYCYGDENSHPVYGWLKTDGKTYYFDESGYAHTGWMELEGSSYYFLEDGSAARGEMSVDGKTHYFASNGQKIVLVNPWHFVPEDYTVELVGIGGDHQIASIAYDDYQEMMTACRAAGMDPVVCSSYRTQEYQEMLYQRRIDRFEDEGYSEEEATALAGTVVAVPGTSEHQLGLALDIIDNDNWELDETQAEMPTQQWLMEHSWEYGWLLRYPDDKSEVTGIIYEPWHYRYVGKEIAAEIHELGVCLEEYLQMLTTAE